MDMLNVAIKENNTALKGFRIDKQYKAWKFPPRKKKKNKGGGKVMIGYKAGGKV